MTMQWAFWVDVAETWAPPASCQRVYIGHESCEQRLTRLATALYEAGRRSQAEGMAVSLVTPPLTNPGLARARKTIDGLLAILGRLEVVCNDWGLLHELAKDQQCSLAVGRLLAGQHTDPRVGRMLGSAPAGERGRWIRHIDGTRCLLKRRLVPSLVDTHYRSSCLDQPMVAAFLQSLGVQRCEISRTRQGVALSEDTSWSYSLHLRDVPVAIMRYCPQQEDLASTASSQCRHRCSTRVSWQYPGLGEIQRLGNALYYRNDEPYEGLPHSIDRLVLRTLAARSEGP